MGYGSEKSLGTGKLSRRTAGAFSVAVVLSLCALALGFSGAQASGEPVRPEGEQALLEKGARSLMGLNETETERVLGDPAAASYVPVGVRTSFEDVEVGEGKPVDGSRQGTVSASAAGCEGERKAKRFNLEFYDVDKRTQFRFTVTKVWCFKAGRVTYGKTGPAQTWVRPDLLYDAEEKEGWKYSTSSEFGTESFVTSEGRSRRAHKSSRAGAFLFYVPGEDRAVGATLAGVNQVGFYNGSCRSKKYTPVIPKITTGPAGTVASRNATFEFSAGRGFSYLCDLDGSRDGRGPTNCTSPKTVGPLSQGNHNFKVRAISPSKDASVVVERDWTVNTTSPVVVSTTPTYGATRVSPTVTVRAVFSKDMDELSLYGGNFTVAETATGTPVDGVVRYYPGSRTAAFDPFDDLEPGSTYTARIEGGREGVKDSSGLALAQSKVWSFTVDSTP